MGNSLLIDSKIMERIHRRNTAVLVAALQSEVIQDKDMELYIQCTTEPVRLFNLFHLCCNYLVCGNNLLYAVALDIENEMERIKPYTREDAFARYIYEIILTHEIPSCPVCKMLNSVVLNYISNSNHLAAIGSLCLIDSQHNTHYLTKELLEMASKMGKGG